MRFSRVATSYFARVVYLLGLVMLLAACTIVPYDQTTDASLSQIQKDVDTYLASLEAPTGTTRPISSPTTKPAFFSQIDSEFNLLLVRTQAREGSDPSIVKEYDSLVSYHEAVDQIWNEQIASPGHQLPNEYWKDVQQNLDADAAAILALELRRKTQ